MLQAHDMYESGAFLKHFEASPFLCALPDGKTATVGIVDHGIDRGGDPWLRLEFKVGNLVVGHADHYRERYRRLNGRHIRSRERCLQSMRHTRQRFYGPPRFNPL